MGEQNKTINAFGIDKDESPPIEEQYRVTIPSIEEVKDENGGIQIEVDTSYDEERDKVLHWLRNSELFKAQGICYHYAKNDIPPRIEINTVIYEGELTKNQILSFVDDFGHYMSPKEIGKTLADYDSDDGYVKFTAKIPDI